MQQLPSDSSPWALCILETTVTGIVVQVRPVRHEGLRWKDKQVWLAHRCRFPKPVIPHVEIYIPVVFSVVCDFNYLLVDSPLSVDIAIN
jgi:hypothetical protein